jgi:CRP-like cAMP-binding protein
MQLNQTFVNTNTPRPTMRTDKPTAPLGGLLDSGVIVEYEREERIFSQGDPADTVMWIVEGRVRLSKGSVGGRDAIIGTLGVGAFLGEEAVAGRPAMLETATTMTPCKLRVFDKGEMQRLLRKDGEVARKFAAHLLSRRIRLEADLADQLTNPSELRLARRLCLLARESSPDETEQRVPAEISQSLLADMVGTTRSRVNMFLGRFAKMGYIAYDNGIRVDKSLRTILKTS